MSLRIFRENTYQLGNLLSHQIAEIIGYLDVFSIDRNTHIRFPFPRSGIVPILNRYAALFAFIYNILCPNKTHKFAKKTGAVQLCRKSPYNINIVYFFFPSFFPSHFPLWGSPCNPHPHPPLFAVLYPFIYTKSVHPIMSAARIYQTPFFHISLHLRQTMNSPHTVYTTKTT